ncbi:hypothetical protein KY312_00910 [Candidatus Woesearchaeota archaeon]|nr:hypothetical protein [Candidatus Woesearchaeota archaeon]
MKKTLALLTGLIGSSTTVAALAGEKATGDVFMWSLYKAAYFAIAAFIFSAIFWLTHNCLASCKKKK